MEHLKLSIRAALNSQFQNYIISKCFQLSIKPQTVVIDFSSPNIAKPFHPGHLRATLLGNFIANINHVIGHKVHRINYLGDWGTQFGYLIYGLKHYKNEYDDKTLSLKYFYEIYAKSYQEFQNKEDSKHVKEILVKLENNDSDLINLWNNVKDVSVKNLNQIYQRLGIQFDAFEFESDYNKISKDLVERMKQETNSVCQEDGTVFYIINSDRKTPILTRDGSSLYLTRDAAAAISRFCRYKPDRIHYVVENGQMDHFTNLKSILTTLGYKINEFEKLVQPTDFHIKFGRVSKMSTRKGNVIFLDDILDDAKKIMIQKLQNEKKITRTKDADLETLAENLGKTIIFCEFLRCPRQNPFEFVWDRDNLGFKLQYCRTSLNSLERRCLNNSITPSLSNSFEFESYDYFKDFKSAQRLIEHMKKWDDVLFKCYMESESWFLLSYTTQMVGLINNTLREVRVIDCPSKPEAEIRLKIFSVAKFMLDTNFSILGFPEIENI